MKCPKCKRKHGTVEGRFGRYETTGFFYQPPFLADEDFLTLQKVGYWYCVYCGYRKYDKPVRVFNPTFREIKQPARILLKNVDFLP